VRSRTRRQSRAHKVDLTALLDTVFLVIVMLLCSLLHMRLIQAIQVERPVVGGAASQIVTEKEILEVSVFEDGRIALDGDDVPLEGLSSALAARAGRADGCLISADRRARHGRVTEVLVAAKDAFEDKPTFIEVKHDPEPGRRIEE